MQTIPAREEEYGTEQLGRIGGLSLHAGVSVNTRECVTPIRCGKVKKLFADANAEADGLKEPVLIKGKGMCCNKRALRHRG